MRLPVGSLVFDATGWGPATGEPVLLLHGFPDGVACWSALGPLLADDGLRAVAPLQRGYSTQARPLDVGAYRLEHLVTDAISFLGALGWESAHVLAHDWGAVVGWALAARHPDLVRSLTAVSVGHPAALAAALVADPDQRLRSSYVALFRTEGKAEHVLTRDSAAALHGILDGSGLDTDQVDAVVGSLLEPGALTAALSWYRALRTADLAAVPDVQVPTTFVWGSDDPALGRVQALGTAARVDAPYEFVEVPGIGHWIPEQRADLLARLVVQQVRRG